MTNGYKEELYPLPVDNSSSGVSSVNDFILLPVPDDEIDGLLFDARHMKDIIDYTVNFTLLLFGVLLLKIPMHAASKTFLTSFLWVICM